MVKCYITFLKFHTLCVLFHILQPQLLISAKRSLNIDFGDSPIPRWPIWMAPEHWDKETLNKLEVCAIRDFSRRAVNCTIMVSYISLLLTGRHHAQETQRANEIFYTSQSRALRNWSDFYADYSSCLQTHLPRSLCFVTQQTAGIRTGLVSLGVISGARANIAISRKAQRIFDDLCWLIFES